MKYRNAAPAAARPVALGDARAPRVVITIVSAVAPGHDTVSQQSGVVAGDQWCTQSIGARAPLRSDEPTITYSHRHTGGGLRTRDSDGELRKIISLTTGQPNRPERFPTKRSIDLSARQTVSDRISSFTNTKHPHPRAFTKPHARARAGLYSNTIVDKYL
ncbi:hypothetical protein EVAR_56755_1 [Eumeta japonica]|uniref:Uncharacterized protein n=1 Tax=Eumeta variegata TaxID=151549 RepID=A0A4C1XNV9_EUMVA|nr:hypothetical protein EVAR_56755_1 [Eumeta japonica]